MNANKLGGVLVAVFGVFCPGTGFGGGLNPNVTNGPPALDYWSFDTNYFTHHLRAPISASNLVNVPYLGDGNCLLVDSPDPAWLQYPIANNGSNLLTVATGSFEVWLAASWSGTNQGGQGPGQFGRIIEVGSYTTNASYGFWSLYTDPAGCNLYFSGQSNDGSGAVYLSAPIAFTTNRWHLISLTYSSTNSCLYIDGALMTNGLPVTYWPPPEVLSNGFYIGSDGTGTAQIRAMIDDLATYDYVLDADRIAGDFYSGWIFYLNVLNKANFFSSAHSEPTFTPTFNAITGPGYLNAVSTNTLNCLSNSNIWITNWVVTAASNGTMNLKFEIAGGVDSVFYDVFANSVLSPASSTNAWAWMGQGQHCVTYLLTNLPNTSAFLILGQPVDDDGDGLTTAWERLVGKTDPLNPDTDGDGLIDGAEVGLYFTDPKNQDSDGDGVIDQPFKVIISRPSGGGLP